MSLTVGEVKGNAEYNFKNANSSLGFFQLIIAKEQKENYEIAKSLGANDSDSWYNWEDKVEEYKEKQ